GSVMGDPHDEPSVVDVAEAMTAMAALLDDEVRLTDGELAEKMDREIQGLVLLWGLRLPALMFQGFVVSDVARDAARRLRDAAAGFDEIAERVDENPHFG